MLPPALFGMQASRCWLRAAHSAGSADGREPPVHKEGRFTFSPEEASSYQSKLREIWHPKFRMPLDSGGGAAWGGCFLFRLMQVALVFMVAGGVGHLGGLPQLRARPSVAAAIFPLSPLLTLAM